MVTRKSVEQNVCLMCFLAEDEMSKDSGEVNHCEIFNIVDL